MSIEDSPVVLGVLVDCSGSMTGKMETVQKAILAAWQQAATYEIPLACWGFSGFKTPAARPVITYEDDAYQSPEKIQGLEVSGPTILAPAFEEVCQAMYRFAQRQRVVIIIFDGEVNDRALARDALFAQSGLFELVGVFLTDGFAKSDAEALIEDSLINLGLDELFVVNRSTLMRVLLELVIRYDWRNSTND
jgi:Mg-chelatase subunit ChlD